MNATLRICFCLGLLAVAVLEGPRAGVLLAESARGPYGAAFPATSAAKAEIDVELDALSHDEPLDPRGIGEDGDSSGVAHARTLQRG